MSGPRVRTTAAALLLAGAALAQPGPATDWLRVDYGALVDGRGLSHSGESVETLLQRLADRPDDRLAAVLLDPLLEPYAFVLPDALDALTGQADPPLVEVGSLWVPAEPQPAWVELLRSRRLMLESDGRGKLRLFAPSEDGPPLPGAEAARRAWEAARPLVRHALAAERRRLGGATLRLSVYPYVHEPAKLAFQVGVAPHVVEVDADPEPAAGPPLDLEALRAALASAARLEGGRLAADGSLTLLESRSEAPPRLLGTPLTLADLAVAYRAVFHGGAAEPYMSLDRAPSPHMTLVNYGGRLRDTRLGWVSLLCDIRFKTFDLGLGFYRGGDLRAELREAVPGFLTHRERFARAEASSGIQSEQVRLWFYPEAVDLTVSAEGDVLALRRVRMTARSEKVEEELLSGGSRQDPPWTVATIAAINEGYDRFAASFPELGDLDQTVRLLSLFTWLRAAAGRGLAIPDLDALLAVELPSTPTPRVLPRLLTFHAMPRAGGPGAIEVIDRLAVAEGLERLWPSSGRPLPAEQRFARAVEALDPRIPDQAALRRELARYDPRALTPSALDLLSYRAERLVMHRTVLTTLPHGDRERLLARERAGDALRVFSIGIGGIDLGMQQALDRAGAARLGLAWDTGAPVAPVARVSPASTPARPTVSAPSSPSAAVPVPPLPPHGVDGNRPGFVVRHGDGDPKSGAPGWWLRVYGADGPEVRTHRTFVAGGRAVAFERYEQGRLIAYRLERSGNALVAVEAAPRAASPAPVETAGSLPEGLVTLRVERTAAESVGAAPRVGLTLEKTVDGELRELSAGVDRGALQRVLLGLPSAEPSSDPLADTFPLPDWLGPVRTLMMLPDPEQTRPPWEGPLPPRPGEEDPLTLARALGRWWSSGGAGYGVVVGTDRTASPERWARAPRPVGSSPLLLPDEGFPEPFARLRGELAAAWSAGPVMSSLPEKLRPARKGESLVVLVSAEAPALFARRLRRLAEDPRMEGRTLAAWTLVGPVRADLPVALLSGGRLAALGLADGSVLGLRSAASRLRDLSAALAAAADDETRLEELDGPFLWFF